MVCGSCHANVSRLSHELQGYTFGLRPGLVQDSGGFCQIISVKEINITVGVGLGPPLFLFQFVSSEIEKGRVLTPRPFFFLELAKSDPEFDRASP